MKSLYVHIPFCDHICTYCDFCKVFYKEEWVDQYLDALSYEISDKGLNGDYDTIYIGGGTPSSLNLIQLQKLFDILLPLSHSIKEFTIEVNPESMDEEKLDLFIQYHVNRLSIGVQTFHDDLLKHIGRYHAASQAIQLITLAKQKGIKDINVDLIYGLPHQTLHDLQQDIEQIRCLDVSHVSIYSLILEEHTLLNHQNYQPLDDEQDAYWYQYINDNLKKIGFTHYEVSNYYKGKPSLHNLVYWHYQDYDGIGLSAHSLKKHHRLENTKSLTQYLNHYYLSEDIKLSQDDELFEKIMMGLRLTEGICIAEMNELFDIDFLIRFETPIQKYLHYNMLEIKDGYLTTTSLGMNYLNTILVDFLD
ncbi:radical SAM family heme chaperone HemW [Candidatus Stoquefichus sp. SB1]|uniref:radical SAM family heme chaperone HemW n=1 Tax=Candidatus Stoquefichus sp. SB1 TaxID=1658109 RepID=UPI00067E6CF9|nr:radical SAM family heme chaperone HemW [Candidatus Stoquefichus sp. SB1]